MQEPDGIFSRFSRKIGLLQNQQVLLGQGDILAAALLQHHHVLDADAEAAGQIDAGLGRHGGSQRQGLVVGGGGIGGLVNFHAHAVAEAVAEIGTVTGVLDDLPGGGVHVVAGGAGLGGGDARQLGLQHDVVDLLGDRDVKSFQAWLDEHVQVEVVSRDRSTDYTAAIAATGRNITEVADRFHLNMNMSDCVTKVIGSHYDEYRSAVRPEEVQETPEVDSRQVMFKEVKELQAEGLNIAQISKKLDIARQTVRKYMGRDTLPKRAGKERLPYYLYDTYVEEEYRHGKDLRKIFMEIKGKGFPGSLTPFYDHYGYLSDGHHGHRSGQEVEKMKQRPNCDREPLLPIRQIAHIADKSIRKERMVHAEVALVEKMMSYGWFRDIYNAASSFHATIMGNDIDELDSWLDSYGKSPIKELRSFAYGIRMDLKAVRNAITLDTSNGIVEGFVNKLKTVKRVMFGRASLDLLKRKMVFSDLCFN